MGIYGPWLFFNIIVCVGALSFLIFLKTKAGKKWKEHL